MNNALTAAEIVVAAAVVGAVTGLAFLVYRTRSLGREGQLAIMAIRFPRGNWRTGMVRYRADRLEWFAFRSLGQTPERTWDRGEFYLGSRQLLRAEETPRAMTGDAVSVDVEYGAQRFSIAMSPGDYTALRSWSESAPPGLHASRF